MQKQKETVLLDLPSMIITDKNLIEKYDKEFDYKFYIPKHELDSVDRNAIKNHAFTEASKELGMQRDSILIAVCEEDPFKDATDSPIRIHGRPWDGKHRYLNSLDVGIRWRVDYVVFRSFDQFIKTRPSIGERKEKDLFGRDVRSKQIQDDIVSLAYKYWKVDGITPKESICNRVVQYLGGNKPYSDNTVRKYCPQEFKEESKVLSAKKGHQKVKVKSKKQIIIDTKDKEINHLNERIVELELRAKPLDEIHMNVISLESDKKKLHLDKIRLLDEVSKLSCSKCKKPVKKHKKSDDARDANLHGYLINELCDNVI